MSCVVGLKHNGKIYIAADGVSTNSRGDNIPVICDKVFWNGDYLIGFVGSIRTGQLLIPHRFTPPKNILDLPDAMYEHFSKKGALCEDEDGTHIHQSSFLIAWKGNLYDILVDFQLNETYGDYNALGSGSMVALGSLYTSTRVKDPEKRILMALRAATAFSWAVGEPYTIEVMK